MQIHHQSKVERASYYIYLRLLHVPCFCFCYWDFGVGLAPSCIEKWGFSCGTCDGFFNSFWEICGVKCFMGHGCCNFDFGGETWVWKPCRFLGILAKAAGYVGSFLMLLQFVWSFGIDFWSFPIRGNRIGFWWNCSFNCLDRVGLFGEGMGGLHGL